MQLFRQEGNALVWNLNYETVRIEPWGRDSLRVRATRNPEILDDLPGALLEPEPAEAQIETIIGVVLLPAIPPIECLSTIFL